MLNLLSTDAANGKSYIAQELENYWISIGLQVRRLTYDEDFLAEDSRFIMANGIKLFNDDIDRVKIGSTDVDKVYVGNTLIWTSSSNA